MNGLHVTELVKTFGEHGFKLGPIHDFTVSRGEAVAVIGANGAGKSTFFHLLTGNLDATSGRITLGDGAIHPDNYALKQSIGYLPQQLLLPEWISARDLLTYARDLHAANKNNLPDVEQWLAKWHCDTFADRALKLCSYGMQKRIGLALATLHQPLLLVIDEPFEALDISHVHNLKAYLAWRRTEGMMTVLSTHIAPYAVDTCERIYVVDKGTMRTHGGAGWERMSKADKTASLEAVFAT